MKPLLLALAVLAIALGCTGARTRIDVEDAATCPQGALSFVMRARHPETYCVGAPNACTNQWLSVLDERGTELVIDAPCMTDCGSCTPVGCPAICAAPSPMHADGERRTWSGTYYASRTCGAGTACVSQACAAAGRYVARMCAYRTSGASASWCAPVTAPTCTTVEFLWPPPDGSTTIEGSIDDGACCPAGWQMYACRYDDGTPGYNCHNPALGCAASTTCGGGCDSAVAGRCGGT